MLFDNGFELLVSEYVDKEFKDKLEAKCPDKASAVYELYRTLPIKFCKSTEKLFGTSRDKKDIPVLSDAIFNNADIILSGDKDFLESDIEKPLIFVKRFTELSAVLHLSTQAGLSIFTSTT